MSLNHEEACSWDNETLLREYEKRQEMLQSMVGWLYASIVKDEMDAIETIAYTRTDTFIGKWRDYAFIPSTWTDGRGVTHAWLPHSSCRGPAQKPDDPVKHITCLLCAVLP